MSGEVSGKGVKGTQEDDEESNFIRGGKLLLEYLLGKFAMNSIPHSGSEYLRSSLSQQSMKTWKARALKSDRICESD